MGNKELLNLKQIFNLFTLVFFFGISVFLFYFVLTYHDCKVFNINPFSRLVLDHEKIMFLRMTFNDLLHTKSSKIY